MKLFIRFPVVFYKMHLSMLAKTIQNLVFQVMNNPHFVMIIIDFHDLFILQLNPAIISDSEICFSYDQKAVSPIFCNLVENVASPVEATSFFPIRTEDVTSIGDGTFVTKLPSGSKQSFE